MSDSNYLILVMVSFLVALVSPSLGTSCGVNFAVMATILPPAAVIPLHGLIEGISSAIRCALMREYVNYRYVLFFTAGGLVGMVCGWPLIGRFSDNELRLILGTFFLLTVWIPLAWMRLVPSVGGALTTCLSVIVGATGPLVAALIARREKDHRVVIGTQGACTVFQHWGKVMLFLVSGFSFVNFAELIVALTAATILGTWIGKRILLALPQQYLRIALKVVVSLLGLKLALDGLNIQIGSVEIGTSTGGIVILALLMLGSYVSYQIGSNNTGSDVFQLSEKPGINPPETQLESDAKETFRLNTCDQNRNSVGSTYNNKLSNLRQKTNTIGSQKTFATKSKRVRSRTNRSSSPQAIQPLDMTFLMVLHPGNPKSVETSSNPTVSVVKQLQKSGFEILNHKMRYDSRHDRLMVKIHTRRIDKPPL